MPATVPADRLAVFARAARSLYRNGFSPGAIAYLHGCTSDLSCALAARHRVRRIWSTDLARAWVDLAVLTRP
jgi:hypothetical protein